MMTGFADHLSATAVGTVPIRARFDHRSRRFRLPCLCRAQLARSCRSTKFPRGFHCPNNIFLQLRFRFQRLLSRQLGLKPKSPFRAFFMRAALASAFGPEPVTSSSAALSLARSSALRSSSSSARSLASPILCCPRVRFAASVAIRRRFQVSLNAGDAWRHVVTGDRLTAFTVRGGYLTAALGAELATFSPNLSTSAVTT